MNKAITLISAIVLSAGLLSGCVVRLNQPQQSQPDVKQQQPATSSPQSAHAEPQANPDTSNFIGEERAKEIALERAGISADGVRFDRVELDRDNGVWQYENNFRKDRMEYDVDVKADDGTVLSYESDYDD